MYNLLLDAHGTTDEGMELVRTIDPTRVRKISVELENNAIALGYSGGPAELTLTLDDGTTITIINGFGVGYKGTGPWGIHDILKEDFHLSEDEASEVFKPYTGFLNFSVSVR